MRMIRQEIITGRGITCSSDYLLEVSLIEGEQLHPLLQYLLIAEKEYTFT